MIDVGYKWKTLEVVSIDKSQPKGRYYLVTCSVCKADAELFPSPFWYMTSGNITQGKSACACTKKYKWTEYEASVLIKRAIADKINISFVGFLGGSYVGTECALVMNCETHGEWQSSTMSNIVRLKTGCPSCAGNKLRDYSGMQQGSWTVLDYVSTKGSSKKYKVHCNVCAQDPELFGDGVFESGMSNFLKGAACCGCNPSRKWTDYEYHILVSRVFEGLPFSLKTLIREPRRSVRGVFNCSTHGDWETNLNNVINSGSVCPACSVGMQNYAYVNIVEGTSAVKFGISLDPKKRLVRPSRRSPHKITPLWVFKFNDVGSCKKAEQECKSTLQCSVLSKVDMPDGYTETTWDYNLDKIKEIYKKHGGVEVEDYYVKM